MEQSEFQIKEKTREDFKSDDDYSNYLMFLSFERDNKERIKQGKKPMTAD